MKRKTTYLVPILFVMYLILLIWSILFKLQFSISDLDTVRSVNLIPFYYDKEIGAAFHIKEVLENVLIFMPIGIFVQMLMSKLTFRSKLMTIMGTSLLIEIAQFILAIGRSDITDLLTNTAGGLLGILLYSLTARLLGGRNKADKLFTVLATIVSVIVIGLMAIILFVNS